ncbi:MAG: discoidin domain-containing protein [Planctomycetota bacterium]
MRCFTAFLSFLCCLSLCPPTNSSLIAQESATKVDRPIHALLVTGGCCHDYDRQKLILTRGISARADVRWTVVHQGGTSTDTKIPLYDDPNWADGFDIVVHNECFAHVNDKEFVDRILKPHREGLPAILIHCAMHCYRVGDDRWFEFCGVQSPGHGPHYSYTINNLKPDHPIMDGFGERFVVPKGELYHAAKVFDTATPLAVANRQDNNEPQVCIWTNDYRGTKVFATTVGHYNETMVEPTYLDMVTKGLLWAVGCDPVKDFTPITVQQDEEIRALATAKIEKNSPVLTQGCCGEGNLVFNKTAKASSEETGKNNFAKNAVDGRLDTRWCAAGPNSGESITIDMEKPQSVRNVRLHWESSNTAYQYTIESSADGNDWTMLADRSDNKERNGLSVDEVKTDDARYLKITFRGSNGGGWGSIWEIEVYPGDLPPLPEGVSAGRESSASVEDVKAPKGFDVRIFAGPPQVTYPVCITTSVDGEVFVGVDEQGSLGKDPGRGKVVRCIDTDGDGKADKFNDFAKMDHPRGLMYDNGSLWVLHPPFLSVFHDVDGDGTSDKSEVLIEGISTDEVNKRGADHTTNGIRMGIDGWIYIAVGDFGFNKAIAKDGTVLSKRGGGVVRIRPDGTEMEVFSWGQRNIVDVAIDPAMNLFTRDNTNDGGGWDIRLSHVMQMANYGYPSQYINFTEEIMPALADYGGGSGCGALYFQDDRWPSPYNDMLLTCDWGRSEVFSHRLPRHGATFDAQQDAFLTIPRPTDADADASGRLFVTSWKNGGFSFERPDVGFVAMVTPENYVAHPAANLKNLNDGATVQLLRSPSDALRQSASRALVVRSGSSQIADGLVALAKDHTASVNSRIAAVWTLRQVSWDAFKAAFTTLLIDAELREQVIRAAADRKTQIDKSLIAPVFSKLDDSNPRVVAAAVIAVGRMGDVRSAKKLLELASPASHQAAVTGTIVLDGRKLDAGVIELQNNGTTATAATIQAGSFKAKVAPGSYAIRIGATEPKGTESVDAWRLPDPDRVIPHLAVKAIVQLNAIEACLEALKTPHRAGAVAALKHLHDPKTVDGLFKVLSTSRDDSLRRDVWTTLIRLYHREGEFTVDSPKWWGTRPDTTGPYYDRQKWSDSNRIADAIKVAMTEADDSLNAHLTEQLKKHVVNLDGLSADVAMKAEEKAIVLPKADPNDPNVIANLAFDMIAQRAAATPGDPEKGKALFKQQSCINCHTFANGQQPKGPHLVDIGRRYKRAELIESIVQPGKKIAQGFDTWAFAMADGKVYTGFVVLESAETVTLRDATGISRDLIQDDIDDRVKQELSMMPNGIVGNLSPEQLADLIAYLESLR